MKKYIVKWKVEFMNNVIDRDAGPFDDLREAREKRNEVERTNGTTISAIEEIGS